MSEMALLRQFTSLLRMMELFCSNRVHISVEPIPIPHPPRGDGSELETGDYDRQKICNGRNLRRVCSRDSLGGAWY